MATSNQINEILNKLLEVGFTEINVAPPFESREDSKVVAVAWGVVGGFWKVNGMKIVDGKHGLFLSYPQHKNADGQFFPISYSINEKLSALLQKQAVQAYHDAVAASQADQEGRQGQQK